LGDPGVEADDAIAVTLQLTIPWNDDLAVKERIRRTCHHRRTMNLAPAARAPCFPARIPTTYHRDRRIDRELRTGSDLRGSRDVTVVGGVTQGSGSSTAARAWT
jgi:hypothetical protein